MKIDVRLSAIASTELASSIYLNEDGHKGTNKAQKFVDFADNISE